MLSFHGQAMKLWIDPQCAPKMRYTHVPVDRTLQPASLPAVFCQGITDAQAKQMVDGLQVTVDKAAAAEQIKDLYRLFADCDCTMVEVCVFGSFFCFFLEGGGACMHAHAHGRLHTTP
jgi:hypothetical protein